VDRGWIGGLCTTPCIEALALPLQQLLALTVQIGRHLRPGTIHVRLFAHSILRSSGGGVKRGFDLLGLIDGRLFHKITV